MTGIPFMQPQPVTERSSSRRGDLLFPLLTVVCDAVAIETSFLFSYWLRFSSGLFEALGFARVASPPIEGYWLGSAAMAVLWILLYASRKTYRPRRRVVLVDELMHVAQTNTVGMLIVMSAAFFYRDFSYSRIVFGLIWVISIPLLYLFRAGVASIERKLHRRGRYLRPAVIIGGDALADNIFVRLQHHPSFGFDIAGYFSDSAAPEGLALAGEKCLGPIAAAPEYIIEHNVEIVFIALRAGEHHRLSALVTACVGINVEFMMVPDIMDILTSNLRMAEYEGLPFLRLKRNPITMWGRITKRIFDVVVSSVTLIVLSPAFLVIALFIKLDSRGPVFFRQKRVGLDGSEFTMYKFRSMAQGSERFDAHARLGIRNDPRQTTVGSFLRRMSLDELPQIYNVWKGEMSLVGPRPERTQFVEEFQQVVPKYLDRHRVKTGLTGWAQVNGFRGDTSLEERIRYDLYYIENWSLAFDIRILLKTLRASLVSRRLEY